MNIVLSPAAARALARSNKGELISGKLRQLADAPETMRNNVKQLRGRPEQRLRVQDWRVIFVTKADTLFVREIVPRGSAYEEKS